MRGRVGSLKVGDDGWMWDLTVPDNNDFYVIAVGTGYRSTLGATGILVHNDACRRTPC